MVDEPSTALTVLVMLRTATMFACFSGTEDAGLPGSRRRTSDSATEDSERVRTPDRR